MSEEGLAWKKCACLFILGVSSVFPTLWGDFVFDDTEAVVGNALVTKPQEEPWTKIFNHDFWGVAITHPKSHKSFRPLTTMTYRLDYLNWGLKPFAFHLENLILHGLNCCLVYHFLIKSLKIGIQNQQASKTLKNVAFWSAVLFAVHPVHVEPLGAVVGRADLMAALVFLLGFIVASDELLSGVIFVTISSIVGSFFKENAVVLFVYYVVLNVVAKHKFFPPRRKILEYSCMILVICLFIAWRLWFQDGPPEFQVYDNPAMFTKNKFAKVFSVIYLWLLNFSILLNPAWLCYDWSGECVPLVETVNDYRLGLIILFLAIGLRFLYCSIINIRIFLVGTLIAAAAFLPSSNLMFTVGFVVAERNLYLVSVGTCLIVTYAFDWFKLRPVLIFIMTMFFVRSIQRSFDWKGQESLFLSGLRVCPGNAKIHYNIATLYSSKEKSIAERYYKSAILLRPDYYQAMNNLGNLMREYNVTEAEYWLREALRTKSDFAAAWMNLGIVLSKTNSSAAIECYTHALSYRKNYPDCEYNLANSLLEIGKGDEAVKRWRKVTTMKPDHTFSWINMIIFYEQSNNLEKAKELGEIALRNVKNSDSLHFVLGNVHGKLDNFETSELHFRAAVEIAKNTKSIIPSKYFSNLGVLYHRWGRLSKARKAYQNALLIDPSLESTRKNLIMLNKNNLSS